MRTISMRVSGVVFVLALAVSASYASAPPAGPIPFPKGTKLAAEPPPPPPPPPRGTDSVPEGDEARC